MPSAEFVNDPTIPDDEVLWRRLKPEWLLAETDRIRISSAAFRTYEASVHIASLTSLAKVAEAYLSVRLAEFTARDARAMGCIVFRNPVEGDPSHAIVCRADHRSDNPKRISGSQAKHIAGRCKVVDP